MVSKLNKNLLCYTSTTPMSSQVFTTGSHPLRQQHTPETQSYATIKTRNNMDMPLSHNPSYVRTGFDQRVSSNMSSHDNFAHLLPATLKAAESKKENPPSQSYQGIKDQILREIEP